MFKPPESIMRPPLSLEKVIENDLDEISNDRKIFDKYEFPKPLYKYLGIEGNAKIFDFWYNKYKKIQESVQNTTMFVKEFMSDVQEKMNNCTDCLNELMNVTNKFDNYKIYHLRGNFNVSNNIFSIMILFNTKDDVYPENLSDYSNFLKTIYTVQENCISKFSPQIFDLRSLYWGDNIDIDSLQKDFPIHIKINTFK